MKLLDWIKETLAMPWFSLAQGIRSKEHDKLLQYIIDNKVKPEVIHENNLVAQFNGVSIWLGSYPYAFGDVYRDKRISKTLPTLRIAYRFNNYISKYIIEEELKKCNVN